MGQTGTRNKPAGRDKVAAARGGSKAPAHAAGTMNGASASAGAAARFPAASNGNGAHAHGKSGSALSTGESLEQSVFRSLEQYFSNLDGAKPHALHEMVLGAIEKPLLQFALHRCAGNQSAAADLLGINRNTLRRKLQDYGLH